MGQHRQVVNGIKPRKYKQVPVEYHNLEYKFDIKESDGNMYNPLFSILQKHVFWMYLNEHSDWCKGGCFCKSNSTVNFWNSFRKWL